MEDKLSNSGVMDSASGSQMGNRSGNQPVRLQDIADAVGTSVATVSMALAGHQRISEAMRKRIVTVSRKMGYQPRRAKQQRSQTFSASGKAGQSDAGPLAGRTLRIGFVSYTPVDQPNNATLVQAMLSIAPKLDARIELTVIDPRDGQENMLRRTMELGKALDGLILVGPIPISQLWQLRKAGIPMVMFGYPLDAVDQDDMPVSIVTSDWLAMGHRAARELFDKGHRRIAFFSGHIVPGMWHERCLDGYNLAHVHAGVAIDKRYRMVIDATADLTTTVANTREAARKIKAMKQPPTAYVFVNTGNALRLHDAMRELGEAFEAPHAIVSHLDLPSFAKEYLSIYMNMEALARTAITQLRMRCLEPQALCSTMLVPFVVRNHF